MEQNIFSSLPKIESNTHYYHSIKTLDELLERDNQREKDGFRRKINIGKIIKPGKGGKNKIVVVPTTTEDKFYHDDRVTEESEDDKSEDTGQTTGTAEGDEGDVIGEAPLQKEGQGQGAGGGSGEGEEHEVLSNAYDLGKVLTEQFQLPNLKEKGNKKSLTKYKYELTDKNRGSGQLLDKKKTIKQLLKTNIALGRLKQGEEIDLSKFIINNNDFIYRTLSSERDFEAQAIVFFLRDYSGSMYGKPTELVCSQHLMIFSWLIYQYKNQVESRFILHDTDAKEVKSFNQYYNSNIAGGTRVLSSFELVKKIIDEENLAKDYNIYIFYGGDGDDWNTETEKFNAVLKDIIPNTNRIGISIIKSTFSGGKSKFEEYLEQNNYLNEDSIRLDVIDQEADGNRLIEGIKKLVSEEKINIPNS
ncbi:MAG: DUF444 family protein [bacterium]|nr:DUF444 family protein [bacterium]